MRLPRGVRPSVWIASTLFGVTLLLTIIAELRVVAGLSTYATTAAALAEASIGLTAMTNAVVGALILSRRTNAIGALLLGLGLLAAALVATSSYTSQPAVADPAATGAARLSELAAAGWFALVGGLAWLAAITLVVLLVQLFPDGRPLSPRWRPLFWLTLVWPVLFLLVTELSPQTDGAGHETNPYGVTGALAEALLVAKAAIAAVFALVFVLASASAVLRFVRARGPQRAQLEWFACGTAVTIAVFALASSLSLGSAGNVINSVALCVIPVTVGVAILRHRLYDIDLLINRTVVYGATTAAIGATFFLGLIALQAVLRPITNGSDLAVAAATLLSFALFQPVRRVVQAGVDRRFDRSRYDAARMLDSFADLLRDEVDLDTVQVDLVDAVWKTMAPAYASLWLRQRPG
jgi:hypothetical protein